MNPQRGEVEITLGGQSYTIRPTFQVLSSIEGALGCGTLAVVQRWTRGEIAVTEVAQILFQALRPMKGPALNKIGEMLMREGYQHHIAPLVNFMARPFTGNDATEFDEGGEAGEAPPPGATVN